LLSFLVDLAMEAIAAAGGREAALGLGEESEDSNSEDEDTGRATIKKTVNEEEEDEEIESGYSTTVITESTKEAFTPPYLRHTPGPATDYSKHSIEDLKSLLHGIDDRMEKEIADIKKKYADTKATIAALMVQAH